MKKLLTYFVLFFAVVSFAAEKEILRLDFRNPHYKEFISHSWGDISYAGDMVKMKSGSGLRTALLPCSKTESIRVTFTGKPDAIEGEDYKVGWCTINYFDESKREFAHTDICYLRGTTEPQTFDFEQMPSARAAYFAVQFTNSGTAGVASYSNIHLYTSDRIADELIADSDLEDILGVNYFFFKRGGADWDNLEYFAEKGEAVLDTVNFATGSKSLRLSGGGATIVSQEFPYHGEEFIFSGWLRLSDDFKAGPKAGWAGGGIQIVGLDDKGEHVAHHDPCLLTSPSPWKYYDFKFCFSPAVKKIQIFARLFEGAQGTVWFDQLRMRRLPAGAVLPFNAKENTLEIDTATAEEAPINYRTWAGVDAKYAAWWLRDDTQQLIPWLKRAGFEMIRIREITTSLNMYPYDEPDGTPHYNFVQFDRVLDSLVGNGFIPNITIDSTPMALAREGMLESGWSNPYPPNDMKKWGAFIEAMFRHCIERYGIDELNKWYWEIWNEPCLGASAGDCRSSVEDFVALSTEIYLAVERVEKATPGLRMRMGMTSGGQAGASDEFLFAKLAELGKLELIRHRSRHYYNGLSEGISMLPSRIKALQEQGALYGAPHYESGCTEWNGTAMQSPHTDRPWCASLAVKMVKVFLDCNLDYSTFFMIYSHPEAPSIPLFPKAGDLTLFTRTSYFRQGGYGITQAVPKSVYNAFLLLNELKGGRRLKVTRSSEPVDAIAVRMDDGTIRILLTNYDEDLRRQPYTTKTTLKFKNTTGQQFRCIKNLACDDEHGNACGTWEKLGRPAAIGDDPAIEEILAASLVAALPCPNVTTNDDGTITVEIALPSPGIRLIELAPAK